MIIAQTNKQANNPTNRQKKQTKKTTEKGYVTSKRPYVQF